MSDTTKQRRMRRLPGRVLRSAGVALVAIALTTCSDNPTAPERPGPGSLSLVPEFPQSARAAGLVLDHVHLKVVRPAQPTPAVIDKTYSFPANSNTLNINEVIQLNGASEDFDVTLEFLSGLTVLYSGTSTITVHQGPPGTDPPASIPLTLQVGTNVAGITVTPTAPVVSAGQTQAFSVTAVDGQGAPVSQFYVGWQSSDPNQPVDVNGVFHAGNARSSVTVTATTPNATGSVSDQVTVQVVPLPATVTITAGDGQSGLVGSVLPTLLAVLVKGSDNLPVPGASVSFAAATGGGSVDSATATTDAAGIARTHATLGPAIGQQTFTATVGGVPPKTFTEQATGVVPSPVTLAAGGDHTCEIRSGNSLVCWGANGNGQLGDGTTTDRLVATPVVTGQVFVSLALGTTHSCALTAGGSAFCWGDNSTGALGDGTTTDRPTPTQVIGGQTFVRLAAGNDFTCGLTGTGQAFCWGLNTSGQLGDGTNTQRTQPTAIAGFSFTAITAGGSHACALTSGGNADCWGLNSNGELGDGTLTNRPVPTPVTGGLLFKDISVGNRSSCALDTNGKGFCWGFNFGAQLTTPTAVAGNFTYISIDMGGDHVCGLTASGLLCGGRNASGQLGDGTQTDRPTPVAPSGGFTFVEVAGGDSHTCGRINANTRRCWGDNTHGQIGDGSNAMRLTPTSVRGPATDVALDLGDGQTAAPGTAVAIPPSVRVTGSTGAALPGVEVIFAVQSGGGSLTGATALTNGSGIATLGSWTLGAAAGANTLTATVSSANVTGNPVTFTATGQVVSPVITWAGTVSTDWSNLANWSPAQVPGAGDDVTIPSGTPHDPALTAGAFTRDLTVQSPATLTLGTFNLQVAGNLTANGQINSSAGIVTLSGGGNTLSGVVNADVIVAGTYVLGGNLALGSSGSLSIVGVGSNLALSTFTATVAGSFATSVSGILTQNQAASQLLVSGNVSFNGGSEVGQITAGVLQVGGNFAQNTTNSLSSFVAAGTHLTRFVSGAAQTITFANSSTAAFQDLELTNAAGGLTLANSIFIQGQLITTGGTTPTLSAGGTAFRAGALNVNGLVLNNAPLQVSGGGPITKFDNVTFQNYSTGAVALDIDHPGAAAPFTFNNLVFSSPLVTGFYIRATDNNPTDGLVLTLNVVNPTPAAPGAFTQVNGGAVINWPAAAPSKTWTGALTVNWNGPGNWSPAGVPTGTDDVLIPSGTLNSPSVTTNQAVRDFTVAAGATVDMPSSTFTVNGNIDVQGTVTVNAVSSVFRPSGAGKTIRGDIDNVEVTGSYSLSGPLNVTKLFSRGSLNINGQTLNVANDFSLLSAGTFAMQNPLDHVIVGGQMLFTGGSTAGLLTEGLLEVAGRLVQDNSGTGNPATSFGASGNHTTRLIGGGARQVDIFNTGTGAGFSHFANLDVSVLTGSVDFVRFNTVFVDGTLTSTPSGAPGTLGSSNNAKLQVSGVNVGRLVFNALPLAVTGPLTRFDNVTFQTMDPTVDQLFVSNTGPGSPFSFNNLVFSSTPTSGSYLSADDVDGASSGTFTIDMVNPTPSTPGTFLKVANGAVVNWPVVAPTKTWTGAVSTDWNTPGNWNPAGVPTITDDVVIPSGPTNQPAITSVGSYPINGLTIQSGAFLNVITGADINASGDVDVAGFLSGNLTLAGPAGRSFMATGAVSATRVVSARTLVGFTVISGDLVLDADLTVNGQTLTIAGILTVNARLVMTNPADHVMADNAAIFQGQSSTGTMTAGLLELLGDFSQLSTLSSNSFDATGTHITRFSNEIPQAISFQNPGASNFNVLDVSPAFGGLTLNTAATANSQLVSNSPSFPPTIHGNGNTLTVTGLSVNGLILDNVLLSSARGALSAFNLVTFNNYAPTATQFTVSQDGPGSPFTFDQVTFTSVPTTGFYISALDLAPADGNVFTVNLTNPQPGSGTPFIQTASGAVVNWPFGPLSNIWRGTISTDWNTAANWSMGHVPNNADDVLIPVGTPLSPQVTTSCSAKSLTVNSGASVDLNGVNCQVLGNVFADGAIFGAGSVQMPSGGQIRGNLSGLIVSSPVTLVGQTFLSGAATITGATGSLDVGAQVMVVGTTFQTQSGGLLKMLDPAAALAITGDATFAGGNELGSMSAGTLNLGGNLTQVGTGSPDSFHPSGTHFTILSAASPTVNFGTPGIVPGSSHFQEMGWSGGGTLTLASNIFAHGNLTVGSSGGTIASSGKTLQLGGLSTTSGVVTFDNTQLIIDQPAGLPIPISNVTFQNMAPTVTQLTVNHPGVAGAFSFINLTFSTTPTTGLYLQANDLDGPSPNALTIDLTGTFPVSPGTFVQQNNGAVVTWDGIPAGSPVWTGAVNTDWSNPGNWSTALEPGAGDDVTIQAAANQPTLTADAFAGSVRIFAGGQLTIGGHTLAVSGAFGTFGTGTFVMTNAADHVTVGGSALFNGGDETGLLSAGALDVAGSFTQAGAVTTFLATGTNTVTMNGATPTINTSSFNNVFQNLNIATSGTVTIASAGTTGGGDFIISAPVAVVANGAGGLGFDGNTSTVAGSTLQATSIVVRKNLTISGSYNVGLTYFQPLSGTGTIPAGIPYTDVDVSGFPAVSQPGVSIGGNLTVRSALTMNGSLSVNGALTISGGSVVLNGNQLNANGDFATSGTGILTMTNAADRVTVGGSALFNGGDETNLLSAGALDVVGDFTQTGANTSFAGSGTNTVNMIGAAPTISTNIVTNVFQNLNIATTGTATVAGSGTTGNGDFTISTPVAVVVNGGLGFDGNTNTVPGSTLQSPSIVVRNNLTIGGTYSVGLTHFQKLNSGTITIPAGIAYADVDVSRQPAVADPGVVIGGNFLTTTTVTLTGSFSVNGGLTITSGTTSGNIVLNGNQLNANGDFATSGTGILTMTNAADRVVTGGNVTFDGGDETNSLSAGTLVLNSPGSFTQLATNSATSFLASGTHKTTTGTAHSFSFASAASHFQDLTLAGSNVMPLGSDLTVAGLLTTFSTAETLQGNGHTVTARSVSVPGLTLDNARMVINENGVGQAEQFDNVTFQNFPTAGTTMLSFTGPGGAAAPRNLTFNTVNFQTLPVGAGNSYVTLTSSNGFGLNLTMQGSNQGRIAGGNGVTNSNPPNEQAVNGATIFWP
jgi:alpha-tubulin suppressor-like RCC1 family protein